MTLYPKLATFALSSLVMFVSLASAHPRREVFGLESGAAVGTVPVTTVVTVLGPNDTVPPPPVDKSEVNVSAGKTHLDVTNWIRAPRSDQGNIQLAILIDNDVRSTILGQQVEDLANFIGNLPRNVQVGLFYGEYGSATVAAPFSGNHKAVAQMVRLSEGKGGDSPNIYQSLADLVSHWQLAGAVRREVVLISSGIDDLYPGLQDPYFDFMLDKVQRAGVVVYTIYDGSSRFGYSFLGDTSQGELIQVAEDTGGESFMQGPITPISIAGYLRDVTAALGNQYLLTFAADGAKQRDGELRYIDVRLEQRNLKVFYPHRVFIPGD